ncbi:DUF779 domain-containing protein [Flavobacterium aciduliphilum]|uniref:DUF779 domain-containing protein n=1 Tax=Flavobacterium aciduliphilum TaxID=1101402 RepID=A0A328YD38_9FLAO|nr:DUF779 domain-containing protein [Flavobacterium aciduliphilum]RAR70022.1 hypothetical protein CLV55_11311 [Flavobacterium aciduliphilum]
MEATKRLDATEQALMLITELSMKHGALMFYQAGGCCEGTQPQCFEKSSFYLRTGDVCIGTIYEFEFWLDKDLFDYWKHMHFTLDVTEGIGAGGFSLETPLGKTFIIKYRLFSELELQNLEAVRINEI